MKFRFVIAAIATALMSTAANAAIYTFSFVPANSAAFSFSLSSSPTPNLAFGNSFEITNVATQSAGATYNANYFFYIASAGGGLFDSRGHDFSGDQLYTGTINAPTFKLGNFALQSVDGSAVSLTIADAAAAAVPEPASWAMMLTGFGVIGFAWRRKAPKLNVTFA